MVAHSSQLSVVTATVCPCVYCKWCVCGWVGAFMSCQAFSLPGSECAESGVVVLM